MAIDVLYEGVALSHGTKMMSTPNGTFVELEAPMPVGTLLVLEEGGVAAPVRVVRVHEGVGPGVFITPVVGGVAAVSTAAPRPAPPVAAPAAPIAAAVSPPPIAASPPAAERAPLVDDETPPVDTEPYTIEVEAAPADDKEREAEADANGKKTAGPGGKRNKQRSGRKGR